METLPVELHSQIFEFACIDDGATARALSLVSHYVREAVAPYLYQSLAVSGLPQMQELVARLERTPPHLRRVRRLFLSDWSSADVHKHSMTLALSDMERYDAERALAARILALSAPTLETLALVVSCPYSAPPLIGELFATPLPRLTALAIHGFYPFPRGAGNDAPTLPKLTHLRLSGNRNPHGLLQLGALEAAAPALTHLRVSDVALAAPFAKELHAAALPSACACDDGRSAQNPAPATPLSIRGGALPPRLRHVAVDVRRLQPRVHSKGALTRGMQNSQEKMLALLREIELRRADTRLDSFVVVEGDGWEMYDELKRGWMAGLSEDEWC